MRNEIAAITAAALFLIFLIPANAAAATTNPLPQIRNEYTLKSDGAVSSVQSFTMPQDSQTPTPQTVSLKGFSNTTIANGDQSLLVSTGTANGAKVAYIQYSENTPTYRVTILEVLQQQANGEYFGLLGANLIPKGTDINLGDVFLLNFTSSEGSQLTGLSAGLQSVGAQDIQSHNATVRELGGYYKDMSQSLSSIVLLLGVHGAQSVLNLKVAGTYTLAMDSTCQTVCIVITILALTLVAVCVFFTVGICLIWTFVEVETVLAIIDTGCYLTCG